MAINDEWTTVRFEDLVYERDFNASSNSSRSFGDKSCLLLFLFRALVALMVVASRVSYLLFRRALTDVCGPHL
jgi:hypothetical protein